MAKITYDDKVYLNENSSVPAINKVQDVDMNEIKSVINDTLLTALGLDTDTFSTSTAYSSGDLVVYDNKIYESNTAIPTAEDFDSSKWDLVPVIDNMKINSKLMNEYSTTEQTIGTWIDGKPIYRKVYQFTTPSTENSWESMGQTGANIETVVDFRGTVLDTGIRRYNSINFGEGSYYIHTAVDAGNNRPISMIQKGWSSLPCVIIIEYTKTTD